MAADKKASYLPLVYVCSPYAGDVETNVKNARAYSRFAVDENVIPVTPHLLYPQFMDDGNASEREMAMHFNYVLLGKCTEVWVFGGVISRGMAREIFHTGEEQLESFQSLKNIIRIRFRRIRNG